MKKFQRQRRAAELRAFQAWTAPVGTKVIVTLDDGTTYETKTRSLPWQLGDGTPVIAIDGRSGGQLLTRVAVLRATVLGDRESLEGVR